jgi:MoxR-like ATPase
MSEATNISILHPEDEAANDPKNAWWIYKGGGKPHEEIDKLPPPPRWRRFAEERGITFQTTIDEIEIVNTALYLRLPLLVTGEPGTGKSSLAHSVAYELNLGPVLTWTISTRSTLVEGLYRYDAINRLQEASLHKDSQPDIGQYLRLGPLGTAMLPTQRPRVLLVDGLDRSDLDLPNDLLNILEEGYFEIPELTRLPEKIVHIMPADGKTDDDKVPIERGRVTCDAFPFIVFTSNGERDFPPAFLRRCLRLDLRVPDESKLTRIVQAHFREEGPALADNVKALIAYLVKKYDQDNAQELTADQVLNAVYLTMHDIDIRDRERLTNVLFQSLTSTDEIW